MRRTASTILLALFLTVGCGDDDGSADPDAGGVPDAGAMDAGGEPEDAGHTDEDASHADEDAGENIEDAGERLDADTHDAGETSDAQVATDAGPRWGCNQLLFCLQDCVSERCVENCAMMASEEALNLYLAVDACAHRECPELQNACINEHCAAEIQACHLH